MDQRPRGIASAIATLAAFLSLYGCGGPEDIGHRHYGYVDGRGELVIPATFLAARPFHEGRASAAVATGWGFIDREGRWVVQPLLSATGDFSEGLAAARDADWRWGFIDREGRWAVPPQFAAVCPFLGGKAYFLTFGASVGLVDHQGRIAVEPGDGSTPAPLCLMTEQKGTDAHAEMDPILSTGILLLDVDERDGADARAPGLLPAADHASEESQVGFADFGGHWVIPPSYEEAGFFVDGLSRVKIAGKVGFIDRAGRVVVDPEFKDALLRFSRGRTIALADDGTFLIDAQGHRLANLGEHPDEFDFVGLFLGYGDFFSTGLLPWMSDDKWGYIDLDGNWAIEPQYDFAQPFDHGRASVQKDGKGYLIDDANRVVATAQLDWVGPSDGTLARTGTLVQWGFLDASGAVPKTLPYATKRIKYEGTLFARTRPPYFSEGLAVVSRYASHRWTLLDAKGRKLATAGGEWIVPAGTGLFAYASGQRWGLLDAKLQPLTDARFDGGHQPTFVEPTTHTNQELAGVTVCVDRKGRVSDAVDGPGGPCEARARYFVGAEGKGVEALDGSWRIPAVYEYIGEMHSRQETDQYFYLSKGDLARVARVSRGTVTYSEPGDLETCFAAELCFATADGQMRRLDPDTLQPTGPAIDELDRKSDGRTGGFPFRTGTTWGFVTLDGRFTIPPEFDVVRPLEDRVLVQRGGMWGAMSPDGGVLLQPRYESLAPAGAGAWAMRIGGKWGVAHDGDVVVVEPRFDDFVGAQAGLLVMETSGRQLLMTGDGRRVEGPSADWLTAVADIADFSDRYWSAPTQDGEFYLIDKRSLEIRSVPPPAGYAWNTAKTGAHFNDLPGAYVTIAGREPDAGPSRFVLMGEDGRYQPDWIFDDANRWTTTEGPGPYTDVIQVERAGKCGFLDASTYRWIVGMIYDHCHEMDGQFLVGQEGD